MMMSVRLLASFLAIKYNAVSANGSDVSFGHATWPYHVYVWGFSICSALALFALEGYGVVETGCFIKKNHYRLFYLVPLSSYLVFSILSLIYILHRMKRENDKIILPADMKVPFDAEEKKFRLQLIKYTIVFILFWICPLTFRWMEFTGTTNYQLGVANVVSISLQAFGNSVVWGTSPHFVKLMRKRCCKRAKRERKPFESDSLLWQR